LLTLGNAHMNNEQLDFY